MLVLVILLAGCLRTNVSVTRMDKLHTFQSKPGDCGPVLVEKARLPVVGIRRICQIRVSIIPRPWSWQSGSLEEALDESREWICHCGASGYFIDYYERTATTVLMYLYGVDGDLPASGEGPVRERLACEDRGGRLIGDDCQVRERRFNNRTHRG